MEKTVRLFGDQMSEDGRMELAKEAVLSGKMSQKGASNTYKVSQQTLSKRLASLGHSTTDGTVAQAPAKAKDSHGRARPVMDYDDAFKAAAVERVVSGETQRQVAESLHISRTTLQSWLKTARTAAKATDEREPESSPAALGVEAESGTTQPTLIDAEDGNPESNEPLAIQRPANAPRRIGGVPKNLRPIHEKERKYLQQRWLPAAQHLHMAYRLLRQEKERMGEQYAGPHGSKIMQTRYQMLAEFWAEAGVLNEFPKELGKPETATLDGLFLELERMADMARAFADAMRMFTGCRPCNTAYKGDR